MLEVGDAEEGHDGPLEELHDGPPPGLRRVVGVPEEVLPGIPGQMGQARWAGTDTALTSTAQKRPSPRPIVPVPGTAQW